VEDEGDDLCVMRGALLFLGGEAEWSGGGGFVDEVGVEELGEVDFEVGIVGVI
jgi:hypothetical protein